VQIILYPFIEQILDAGGAGFSGNDYDRYLSIIICFLHPVDHLDTAHSRHIQIGKNQINGIVFEYLKCLLAITGLKDLVNIDINHINDTLDRCACQ
jgi:hypothetical protein